VYDAWKVLNHERLPGGKVVVIGGGLVGAETAELLTTMGCEVTIVEMMEEIAKEESTTVKPTMFASFEQHHVQLLTKTKVTKITASTVEAENEEGLVSLPCDYVILAVGAKPNTFDAQSLIDQGIPVDYVGDCHDRAADINRAIEEGYLAANRI
ncbi:MAG: FAD-dependent oxidoreductase, partial [Beduini sp.]